MTQVNAPSAPPPWGYDSDIKNPEATFQVAMLLGNLESYINRYLHSDAEKPEEVKEIGRLKDLINKYLAAGKVDPPVKDLAQKLMTAIGDMSNEDCIKDYKNSYNTLSAGQQLYNWAFPSGGKMPYTINQDTNPDTKASIYLFLNSLPDAATKLEELFSKDGMLGNFGEESKTFLAAWIMSHKKDIEGNGENFNKFIQDFANTMSDSDTDPTNKTFDIDQFVKGLDANFVNLLFGNLSDDEIKQKRDALANHISIGLGGTDEPTAPTGGAYGASAPRAGGSSPLPPHPPLPPSGGPDGSLPDYPWGGLGEGSDPCYDKLLKFIEYLGRVKGNDPAALANFADYVANLVKNHKLDAKIVEELNKMGVKDLLVSAFRQSAMFAFFTSTPPAAAEGNMKQYLEDVKKALEALQKEPGADKLPFDAMLKDMDALLEGVHGFAQDHYRVDPNNPTTGGELYWGTENWTHPRDQADIGDRFFIQTIISGQDPAHALKHLKDGLDDLLVTYKLNTLQELLVQFKGDPTIAIMLWITQYLDRDAQADESGLNNQSQVVTKILTDKFANGLQTLGTTAGAWGAADIDKLKQLLDQGKDFMKYAPEMGGIADNWKENVTGPIENIQVPVFGPDGKPQTPPKFISLGDYLRGPGTPAEKADFLNKNVFKMAAPTDPTDPTKPGYQTNPNYQIFTGATTTGEQLANGMSKNVTTQLSTLSAWESAIAKVMEALTGPQGMVGMFNKIVSQQIAR